MMIDLLVDDLDDLVDLLDDDLIVSWFVADDTFFFESLVDLWQMMPFSRQVDLWQIMLFKYWGA
jgi:hypothetical protein